MTRRRQNIRNVGTLSFALCIMTSVHRGRTPDRFSACHAVAYRLQAAGEPQARNGFLLRVVLLKTKRQRDLENYRERTGDDREANLRKKSFFARFLAHNTEKEERERVISTILNHFRTQKLPSAGLKQTAPPPKPGSAQGFFLLVREFFLATVALGLL